MFKPTAALAALLCVAILAACGSGTETVTVNNTVTERTVTEVQTEADTTAATDSTPTTDTTTAQTPATSPDGGGNLALSGFQSPSGNIGCVMVSAIARCDIKQRSWSPPPRPSNCPLDWGQGLTVGRSGPGEVVCAGDTALNPEAKVLPYGSYSRIGDLACHSAEDGVTCMNEPDGHGFFISRQSYRLF